MAKEIKISKISETIIVIKDSTYHASAHNISPTILYHNYHIHSRYLKIKLNAIKHLKISYFLFFKSKMITCF